jgi:hypothetical protein
MKLTFSDALKVKAGLSGRLEFGQYVNLASSTFAKSPLRWHARRVYFDAVPLGQHVLRLTKSRAWFWLDAEITAAL